MFSSFFQPFAQMGGSPNRKAFFHDSLKAMPQVYFDKPEMEKGNKVLLPASALNQLSHAYGNSPMIFCVQNTFLNLQTFVGVLEFTAPERTVVLPNWLFTHLQLEEEQLVNITLNTELKKGKYVKIQPHETEFIDSPDPRAILEHKLRFFTCLTIGDTLYIDFASKVYKVDILDIKPSNQYNAICLVDTDVEVDFAPPLDYKEEAPRLQKQKSKIVYEEEKQNKMQQQQQQQQQQTQIQNSEQKPVLIGKAVRIDGKQINEKQFQQLQQQQIQQTQDQKPEPYNPRKHRLINGLKKENQFETKFQGEGKKLK